MSTLSVLPICSEGLLNLLTICLILSRLCLWLLLLLLLLIWLLFLVLLVGGAPSISATSFRLLLDPPLASLDLPGPPGCLFPVMSLLNGVAGHLKSVAQPVCDALMPVICSYRMQYMYAAIILVCLLALGLILF